MFVSKAILNLFHIFLTLLACLWKTMMSDEKNDVVFNRCKEWYSETLETYGVLNKSGMTNSPLKNCSVSRKKKEGQNMCVNVQEVSPSSPRCTVSTSRALIDLRLLNFALIKEWSCSAPFFLLILTLFIWLWFGHSWAQCVDGLVPSVNVWCSRVSAFIFVPTSPFYFMWRSERWLHSEGVSRDRVSESSPTCKRQKADTGEGGAKLKLVMQLSNWH